MSKTSLVISLGLTQTLAWGSSYYLPAIIAAPMARDLGISQAWIFGAFSAALIVSAFLGPWAGAQIDRRGGRDVLVASNLIFATGLGLLATSDGLVSLFSAWVFLGAGMALGLYEAAFSTLAVLYGTNARSSITGITLIAGFASTICWPISAYLDADFGWRATCYFWAALHILVGLPLNCLTPPRRIGQALAEELAPVACHNGKKWDAALLAFIFAVTWFTSTAMAAHLPHLLQEAGVSTAAAVAAGALIGPSQVAARIAEFGLLRKVSPLFSARLAAIAHPLGAVLLGIVGPPAAALFVILHGAGNGVMTIAKGTLPLAIFGAHGYGLRQGVLMVPARFAQAAAPFAFGFLVDSWGARALVVTGILGLMAFAALAVLSAPSSVPRESS